MKKLIPLIGVLVVLAGFYLYLLYSVGGRLTVVTALGEQALIFLLALLISSLLVWAGYYKLLSRIPWRLYPGIRIACSWLLLWALGIGFSWAMGLLLENTLTRSGLYGAENFQVFVLTGAIVSLLMSLLFTLSDFSWYAYYRFASKTLARLRAQHRQKELQFDVLRAQLTPHYLFNSLNTASNLISYNSQGAEAYIRKLAHNIRYLMEQPDEVLSSIAQELEVVDSFFHLMQVRYGERIQLSKEVDERCLQQQLPRLALQLLVENAIKHNVASKETPVHISIRITSNGAIVENNITRKPQDAKSAKVGLHNLRERYAYLSGKSILIQQSSSNFLVELPYIKAIRKEAYV